MLMWFGLQGLCVFAWTITANKRQNAKCLGLLWQKEWLFRLWTNCGGLERAVQKLFFCLFILPAWTLEAPQLQPSAPCSPPPNPDSLRGFFGMRLSDWHGLKSKQVVVHATESLRVRAVVSNRNSPTPGQANHMWGANMMSFSERLMAFSVICGSKGRGPEV